MNRITKVLFDRITELSKQMPPEEWFEQFKKK
jgi:hypothetical protein